MELVKTSTSWIDEIRSDIVAMEWDWRSLDEMDSRGPSSGGREQVLLGKREKEAEASRLHAELAVASFVDEFYGAKQTDVGKRLIASADVKAWTAPPMERQQFADFVQAEVERVARPDVSMYWRRPVPVGKPASGEWWTDLEGVRILHGEEPSRPLYRFRVVEDQVDAWLVLAEEKKAA